MALGELSVSVVVPTFERAEQLRRTLSALCALDYPAELLEIIVVDDGSMDDTPEALRAIEPGCPSVRYVRQSNLGVATARNRGARYANGDIVMFVDDDIVVPPHNVRQHLAARAEYGECIVSGHSEFSPELRAALHRTPFGRFRLEREDYFKADLAARFGSHGRILPDGLSAQNISIGRDTFWTLGGFDEEFPFAGAEDHDFARRARQAGCTIVHDYDIRVLHLDEHRDLHAYCRRQERSAITAVYLARKYPDQLNEPIINRNAPLRRGDSVRVSARKITRALLSHRISLAIAHLIVGAIELLRPKGGWPLEVAYRWMTGLYVFRGVRLGFRLTSAR
ncbi:MAG: glycosyltransferase [Actinobacteria bacterium]|nr:MAG: glycosyltransferase [Actinomycetota bacterium]